MSNNTVNVSGFLSISRLSTGGSARQPEPIVEGWISTAEALVGGWHPFRAEGRQAEVILDYARQASTAGGAATQVGVSIHARLVSHPRRSYLEVKFISFFDTSYPVANRREGFAHSTVTLQGHLTIRAQSYLQPEQVDPALFGLPACLATGTLAQGGQHPVLIRGEELAALRQDAHFQTAFRQHSQLTLPATLSGKLYTHSETIYVLVSFLSLDTRPMLAEPARLSPRLRTPNPLVP